MQPIQRLLEAIQDVINLPGSWQEKRDRIRRECTHDEETALLDFISWFPEEDN